MPPPVDQLQERRKQRGERDRAARADDAAGRVHTAEAARDLFTGLIAGEEHQAQEPYERLADPVDQRAPTGVPAREHDAEGGHGESVQDLVRRVREHTATAMQEASSIAPRRAPSTVDLPIDAAGAKRRQRPLRTTIDSRWARAVEGPKPRIPRWAVTPPVAAAGLALLLVLSINALGGGRVGGPAHASSSIASLTPQEKNPLGDAFNLTLATVAPDLDAIARSVAPGRRAGHQRRQPARHQVNRSRQSSIQKHPMAVSHPSPASQSASAGAGGSGTGTGGSPASETHSYTPSSSPASSTRHTSAGSQTPATSSRQPAGPTGSDPLGGIGSCVSGCT
jgi:hypothetical protein